MEKYKAVFQAWIGRWFVLDAAGRVVAGPYYDEQTARDWARFLNDGITR